MSSYHALAKSAAPGLLKAVGKTLMSKGLWGVAEKGGERLARHGGKIGKLGQGLASTSRGVQKASPLLMTYGAAGMVGDATGSYDLPGSEFAFNIGMPGIGLAMAAAPAIRTARLSTGKYNDDIEADVRAGASQAGQDWITATHRDPTTARDAGAFQRYLQENGADTTVADRYLSGHPVQRQGWWKRLGHAVSDPTQLVMPQVQQGIYDQLHKGAADEMEKVAWALAARAAQGAWTAARALAPKAKLFGAGTKMAPQTGLWGSAKGALRAGAETTGAGRLAYRGMDKIPKGILGHAMNTGFVGYGVYEGANALSEDKPYDELTIQQEGYDGAQAGIRDRLAKMTPFERQMAQFDPSLAVGGLEKAMPGTIAAWEASTGQKYQPGFMGGIQQAWQNRGTPTYYSHDSTGERRYL